MAWKSKEERNAYNALIGAPETSNRAFSVRSSSEGCALKPTSRLSSRGLR